MNYLIIYPEDLLLEKKPDGSMKGDFTFEIEQYGLRIKKMICAVELVYITDEGEPLPKIVIHQNADLDGIGNLGHILNVFLFRQLNVEPKFEMNKNRLEWHYFFHDVYFDLIKMLIKKKVKDK
jgi:hypothetical protein